MIENTSKVEFLRVGLERYPDACETVDYFEKSVTEAIVAAFKAKTNWKNFRPHRGDSEGSLQTGNGTGDRFIHAFMGGTLPNRNGDKEKVWIDLGFYWNPPRRPMRQFVAACFCWLDEDEKPVSLLDLPSRDQKVELGPVYKRNERQLVLEARAEDFDPEKAFSLLLDSIDEALGVVDTVNRTSVDSQ